MSANNHRTVKITVSDYKSPWKIHELFGDEHKRNKVYYCKCSTCVAASKREAYNRAAFKRGENPYCGEYSL